MSALHVLLYTSADDVAETAPVHFPAHSARVDEFAGRGDLLAVGTFGETVPDGSMAIFGTREAAEAFAEGDPFVRHGVVVAWELRQWNEILGGVRPAPAPR